MADALKNHEIKDNVELYEFKFNDKTKNGIVLSSRDSSPMVVTELKLWKKQRETNSIFLQITHERAKGRIKKSS